MVTGRKLLLADDSATIQKVIDLTFSDEGLEVITVSDGRQAIEKLDEVLPDIVLADVFMPGASGYEVCEYIKRTERFSHIPVMLLVGSFEPFDEAEARRVGADDYLTKPFQSIRTLIGKVGGLLSGGGSNEDATTRKLVPPPEAEKANRPETDFLERSTADTAPLPQHEREQAAAAELAADARAGSFNDLSMDDELIETMPGYGYSGGANAQDARRTAQYSAADFAETGVSRTDERAPEPQEESFGGYSTARMAEPSPAAASAQPVAPSRAGAAAAVASSDDALLDLGDLDAPPASMVEADDFILDLQDETDQPVAPVEQSADYEALAGQGSVQAQEYVDGQVVADEAGPAGVEAPREEFYVDAQTAPTERLPEDFHFAGAAAAPAAETTAQPASAGQITLEQLSPEAIEAIARRAAEMLSERVVEQIAWEVVPDLAERLIRRRLEEERR